MRTQCPHCGSTCTSRKTQQITPVYREVTFSCDNLDCGHVFVSSLEPVRTLSPAMNPDPDVRLPMSNRILKEQSNRF